MNNSARRATRIDCREFIVVNNLIGTIRKIYCPSYLRKARDLHASRKPALETRIFNDSHSARTAQTALVSIRFVSEGRKSKAITIIYRIARVQSVPRKIRIREIINRDVYNYHEKIIRCHKNREIRSAALTRSVLPRRELHLHVFAPLRRVLFRPYVQVLHELAPVYSGSAIRLFLGCPPERRLRKINYLSARVRLLYQQSGSWVKAKIEKSISKN